MVFAFSMKDEADVPDWVTSTAADSPPVGTVIFDGSPNAPTEAPRQIFVQGQYGGPGVMMPKTNAVLALVLGIAGLVMCSVCTAIPGLILANGALATTNNYPGHPDQGLAKAAQIISWIVIGLTAIALLIYGGIGALLVASGV